MTMQPFPFALSPHKDQGDGKATVQGAAISERGGHGALGRQQGDIGGNDAYPRIEDESVVAGFCCANTSAVAVEMVAIASMETRERVFMMGGMGWFLFGFDSGCIQIRSGRILLIEFVGFSSAGFAAGIVIVVAVKE